MKRIASIITLLSALTASAEYIRQATETYPGGGSTGGVTPGVATNISENIVQRDVAPWAMAGQPVPSGGGVTTNAVKDIVANEGYIKSDALNGYATETWVEGKNYVTETVTNGILTAAKAHADQYANQAPDYANVSNLAATAVQTEVDPTVSAWAKAATKPTYTAAEVGADATGTAAAATNALATVAHTGSYNDLTDRPAAGGITTNDVKNIASSASVTNAGAVAVAEGRYLKKIGPNNNTDIHWDGTTTPDSLVVEPETTFERNVNFGGGLSINGSDIVFNGKTISAPGEDGTMALKTDIPSVWSWNDIEDTPKDISGYGITNAYTKSEIDAKGYVTESVTNGILEAANEYTDEQVGGVWVTLNPTHTATTNIQAYLGGQNVRVSVTNYYGASSGNLPRLRIEENVSNNWTVVWDEDDKFGLFQSNIVVAVADMTNTTITVVTNALHAGLATKAPLAWGSVTSRGGTTPDDTVWISHPKTVFAGDAEFQSVAVGAGEIYVVVSKGTGVYSQGNPGTFRFTTADNDWYFGMRIEDSYLLGCNTDGITVTPIAGGNMVTLDYNVTMVGKPILYYKSALTNEVWEQLNDSTGAPIPGASVVVSWEAAPPAAHEYAYINVGAAPQGYFTAYVETAGSQSFETNLPIDAKGGILCSNETTHAINVIEPYFDAGGEIKWRVKP